MTGIALPPLLGRAEIDAENVLAVAVIYAAFQLEAARVIDVADRLVEMFQQGLLPVGPAGGALLTKYFKDSGSRFSADERRAIYCRAIGHLCGASDGRSNREFDHLWMRFVSAISAHAPGGTLRRRPDVRRSARDLAANLSLHGYGIGYFAAVELRAHIAAALRVISRPEIRAAFGARNMWQVVEAIAARDLGGAANSARYRTQAASGVTIIEWVAAFAGRKTRRAGSRSPTDRALVSACAAWLGSAPGPRDSTPASARSSNRRLLPG